MSLLNTFGRWFSGESDDDRGPGSGHGISCREAVSVVQEFLDGALDDADQDAIEAHFEMCTRCYPHLRFEKSFREALSKASHGEAAPADVKTRVAELLARAAREGSVDEKDPTED